MRPMTPTAPSDSRVRPDDLRGTWEVYPHDQLRDLAIEIAKAQDYPIPPERRRRYSWTDHERRLIWRALMNVAGVLLCVLIALLWIVQYQASR